MTRSVAAKLLTGSFRVFFIFRLTLQIGPPGAAEAAGDVRGPELMWMDVSNRAQKGHPAVIGIGTFGDEVDADLFCRPGPGVQRGCNRGDQSFRSRRCGFIVRQASSVATSRASFELRYSWLKNIAFLCFPAGCALRMRFSIELTWFFAWRLPRYRGGFAPAGG